MSALASSPEFSLSPSSDSSEPPPHNSAPKRKKRQNFSGLTPQQKVVAKKANNRQAAQNLRDRKKQREVELEQQVQRIEETNERLAAQLSQLARENKAIQDEARTFANQHIERFKLHGMAQRLMSAVQRDPGNGTNITALLAAMGSALEAAPLSPATADPLASSPATAAAAAAAAAVDTPPQPMESDDLDLALDLETALASPPAAPVDLSGLPEVPAELLMDLLPPQSLSSSSSLSSPAIVPQDDELPELSLDALSPLTLTHQSSSGFTISPVPALPTLATEVARGASHPMRALETAQTSNHSAAAGAWPAVPPLPSGLQQLLMVLICTSLMRLPQAPASSSSAAAAVASRAAAVSSTTSLRPSSPSTGSRTSAPTTAACCSSYARCTKEYGHGAVCSPRSPEMLACAC